MESTPVYWSCLPSEIRRMILEILVGDRLSIPCYASVCREWQQAMEQIAFRQIRITPSRFPDLVKIGHPRQRFIECINFHISLQEYDCLQCGALVKGDWYEPDINLIEAALRNLFVILSTWEPRPNDRQLILDITISCPSDDQHYFKNCFFDDTKISLRDAVLNDDPRHGWINGRQIRLPPWEALCRIFQFLELSEDFWPGLPQVVAVTGLQVRRQNHRQFEPRTLQRLLTFLPMAQTICYEPWREWTRGEQEDADESLLVLFKSLISSRIEHLMVFEDFDDKYLRVRFPTTMYECNPEPLRTANGAVSGALAQVSRGLKTLSASFLVDAVQFFSACQPNWTWHELTSVTLTSRTLVPNNGDHMEVNELLRNAARFAVASPNLTTVTLWNYNSSNTCAFVYQASPAERCAKITWRATWKMVLEPATIRSWDMVVAKRRLLDLSIANEEIDASVGLRSRGDAIEHLGLVAEVIP